MTQLQKGTPAARAALVAEARTGLATSAEVAAAVDGLATTAEVTAAVANKISSTTLTAAERVTELPGSPDATTLYFVVPGA